MEPSDAIFVTSHTLYDSKGDVIPHPSSRRSLADIDERPPLLGCGEEEEDEEERDEPTDLEDHTAGAPFDSGASLFSGGKDHGPLSVHSAYTIQSVLLAEGVLDAQQLNDDRVLNELPDRYDKGSVKAKITWFGALCLAGIGMFVEALVIITTGQIKTVWTAQYPECWHPNKNQSCPENIQCCGLFPNTPSYGSNNSTCAATLEPPNFCQEPDDAYPRTVLCNSRALDSVSYSNFAGIMAGMFIMGVVVDRVGHKRAGTITSLLMLVGITGMVLFESENVSTIFVVFASFFGCFGLGVGGEYPLSASGAAAYHAKDAEAALLDDEEQHRRRILMEAAKTVRRGETMALVFAMQGVGAVVGSVLLLIMIFISNQTQIDCGKASSNSTGNNPDALNGVWRGFYLIGGLLVLMLLLYRWLVLEKDTGHAKIQQRQKRRETRLGKRKAKSSWKLYAPRLVGTGGNWFVFNFSFYGLKLFSGPILAAINPAGDLLVQNGWLLVNNLCALVGYYCSALVIDKPWVGRKRLQMMSFAVTALLFMMTAAIFESARPQTLMFLFFASSFFGNFGVNVTTYVMAAETYPAELRGTYHGTSAFLGKTGALLATIIFGMLDTSQIFWACGVTSVIGLFLTFFFSVDLTNVSLAEHDAQLELFLEDRLDVYKGQLNSPQHLSVFEKWTGRHGDYDILWASKLMDREKSREQSREQSSPKSLSASLLHKRRIRSMSSGTRVRELFATVPHEEGLSSAPDGSTPIGASQRKRRQVLLKEMPDVAEEENEGVLVIQEFQKCEVPPPDKSLASN